MTTLLMALVMGWFAIATILAETLTPRTQNFSRDLARSAPASNERSTVWAAAAAPLRGDLLADAAIASAAPALDLRRAETPEMTAIREDTLATARRSLALTPHASNMWLLVAMLQAQEKSSGLEVEELKMSYLTGPADVNLIPARLATVFASDGIKDADLKNLARGDIRLILTHRPDLKDAIASAYRSGSADGKAYIGELVKSLDPGFTASLP